MLRHESSASCPDQLRCWWEPQGILQWNKTSVAVHVSWCLTLLKAAEELLPETQMPAAPQQGQACSASGASQLSYKQLILEHCANCLPMTYRFGPDSVHISDCLSKTVPCVWLPKAAMSTNAQIFWEELRM